MQFPLCTTCAHRPASRFCVGCGLVQVCAPSCEGNHRLTCTGKCKFDNERAFRKKFGILDTVQSAKKSRNVAGATIIQKLGYTDSTSGLGLNNQGIVAPISIAARGTPKAGIGLSHPPNTAHVIGQKRSRSPQPDNRVVHRQNDTPPPTVITARPPIRGVTSTVPLDSENCTKLADGSDRHYLLQHVWHPNSSVSDTDVNKRLWHASATYKEDTQRSIKRAFIRWWNFMKTEHYLDDNGAALMLHDGLDKEAHQNMMNLFVHHLVEDLGVKGDSLTSSLSHLRSNWKLTKNDQFIRDLFTTAEWTSLAKEGALNASELRAKLQNKIARTRVDISDEMMDNGRKAKVEPILTGQRVTRKMRTDLMTYVGANLTRECGFRGCTVALSAREKDKERVLIGRDLAFLVGKGTLLPDGSFSEGLHRATSRHLATYLRGTFRAMEAKLWRVRAVVVMNAITKSGQQGMVEIGWRTERELQCVHDIARWIFYGRVIDEDPVFRVLGETSRNPLHLRTQDLTDFVRFTAATIPEIAAYLINVSSHSLRKSLATAVLDSVELDPASSQPMMSDEVIRGLEYRATWTRESKMPTEVYHVRDKAAPYDIMDRGNRGPSAVKTLSFEEKRKRMADILRKIGHLTKDNEENDRRAHELMCSLNVCATCPANPGEGTYLTCGVLCCGKCEILGETYVERRIKEMNGTSEPNSSEEETTQTSNQLLQEIDETKEIELGEADLFTSTDLNIATNTATQAAGVIQDSFFITADELGGDELFTAADLNVTTNTVTQAIEVIQDSLFIAADINVVTKAVTQVIEVTRDSGTKKKHKRNVSWGVRFSPTAVEGEWLEEPVEGFITSSTKLSSIELSIAVKDFISTGLTQENIADLGEAWRETVEALKIEVAGEGKFPVVKVEQIALGGQFMIYHTWLWSLLGSLGRQSFTKEARERLISVERYFNWASSMEDALRTSEEDVPLYYLVRYSAELFKLSSRIMMTKSSGRAKEITPVRLAMLLAGMDAEGTGFTIMRATRMHQEIGGIVRLEVVATTATDEELETLGLQWNTEERTVFKMLVSMDYKYLEWPVQSDQEVHRSIETWMNNHESLRWGPTSNRDAWSDERVTDYLEQKLQRDQCGHEDGMREVKGHDGKEKWEMLERIIAAEKGEVIKLGTAQESITNGGKDVVNEFDRREKEYEKQKRKWEFERLRLEAEFVKISAEYASHEAEKERRSQLKEKGEATATVELKASTTNEKVEDQQGSEDIGESSRDVIEESTGNVIVDQQDSTEHTPKDESTDEWIYDINQNRYTPDVETIEHDSDQRSETSPERIVIQLESESESSLSVDDQSDSEGSTGSQGA